MKIIRLSAENVKKLKAIEIKPDGNTVLISGKNNQGKTSVLDAIWLALGGGEAAKGIRKPIRKGEERASVSLDLGDMTVTRTWTADDRSYLQVTTKDGAKYPAPQALLDGLIGNLAFDPLAFTRLPEKEQARTLMGMVKLSVNPDEIDAQIRSIFENRTIATRGLKQLEAQLAGMKPPADGLPEQEIPAETVAAEYRQANEQALAIQRMEQALKDAKRKLDNARTRGDEIRQRIEELKEALANATDALDDNSAQVEFWEKEMAQATKEFSAMPRPDLGSVTLRLQEIEQTNRQVRDANTYRTLQDRVKETKTLVENHTAAIGKLQQTKAEAIRAAKYPIEGLGFDDSGVTFQGIPLAQCAASEQLRVSMAIAMALNPKLRVIRILDGSLLDQDNLRVIQEMAAAQDFQIWCEVVDSTGKIGVYIEDGAIAAVNN